jgi:hypothetical protein
MEWRVAMWADVESVLGRLSDQHRVEFEPLGYPDEPFKLRLLHFLTAGECHCLWFDGQPQAFLAIAEQNGVVTTWLGVTKEAFDRGAGPVKAGRAKLREVADRLGPITSFITSTHPKVGQWMKLFGFAQKGDAGSAKIFVFV